MSKTIPNDILIQLTSNFLANMPMQLPDLLPTKSMDAPIYYDDYALLKFYPTKQLTIEQAVRMMEEEAHLKLMFHRASPSLHGHQCCCAFTNPCGRRMYKFNATADDKGVVDCVQVSIYECMERMRAYLRIELYQNYSSIGMRYMIPEAEMLRFFF